MQDSDCHRWLVNDSLLDMGETMMDKETLSALGAMLVSIVLISIPICIVLYLLGF